MDVPGGDSGSSWRGLAALTGSWIGGGANFVAVGESAGATAATMSLMVVVDVAVGRPAGLSASASRLEASLRLPTAALAARRSLVRLCGINGMIGTSAMAGVKSTSVWLPLAPVRPQQEPGASAAQPVSI